MAMLVVVVMVMLVGGGGGGAPAGRHAWKTRAKTLNGQTR
jgi:hypothetical protein